MFETHVYKACSAFQLFSSQQIPNASLGGYSIINTNFLYSVVLKIVVFFSLQTTN